MLIFIALFFSLRALIPAIIGDPAELAEMLILICFLAVCFAILASLIKAEMASRYLWVVAGATLLAYAVVATLSVTTLSTVVALLIAGFVTYRIKLRMWHLAREPRYARLPVQQWILRLI